MLNSVLVGLIAIPLCHCSYKGCSLLATEFLPPAVLLTFSHWVVGEGTVVNFIYYFVESGLYLEWVC